MDTLDVALIRNAVKTPQSRQLVLRNLGTRWTQTKDPNEKEQLLTVINEIHVLELTGGNNGRGSLHIQTSPSGREDQIC